ncbi:hypothetical protein LCGC14_2379220 [marine sediment metagenome]|uniref:Exonuclease domain-containing protein n=1 Tax=marine sediment metagenome TaxID=412755 RepID=A0A0F9C1E5_9ZZZZ
MLIWIDTETTGIGSNGWLLEVGCIITDDQLSEVARLALVVEPDDPVMAYDYADEFVQNMHTENGLWDAIRNGEGRPKAEVEVRMLNLVLKYSHGESYPMCGSSIGFDRRWLKQHMPALEAAFHYRNIDVSTVKELHRRFSPHGGEPFEKTNVHRVLSDLEQSIAELHYYLKEMDWRP